MRLEIDHRLGEGARLKMDEIQGLDSMMAEQGAEPVEGKKSKEHEELVQHPEVREKLTEVICQHWESWVDQTIPALVGKTPRIAVKTADGREAVEALLPEAERGRGLDPYTEAANRKGTQRARELLGLKAQ